jgi:hypothetical protein
MSMSVDASSNALSTIQSLLSAATGGQAPSDPLDELLEGLASPADGASDPAASPTQSGNSAGTAYDPSTFSSLLSAQGQQDSQGVAPSSSASGHVGAGAGSASGSDDADSADSATTQTVVNPDGSTTTIVTYADGTEVESSTPAPQGINATATSSSAGSPSANKALTDLFQSVLAPAAGAALSALI